MIRATIIVNKEYELIDAYRKFREMEHVELVRIKNKLDEDLRNISMNFSYGKKIIGEIQIRYSSK